MSIRTNFLSKRATIEKEIREGYVSRNFHPHLPLFILNYTHKSTNEWRWTEETMLCRGLILDEEWNVVGRSFRKFFTLEQYEALEVFIPEEDFTVYDKLDGVLFIVTLWTDPQGTAQMITSTRGSFSSEWAHIGRDVIREKYPDLSTNLQVGRTYNFELLTPRSRAEGLTVVDYGDEEDIRLLAVIENSTGRTLPLEEVGPPTVLRFRGYDWKALEGTERSNAEGFVVEFERGLRLKVKLEEYKQIHKVMVLGSQRRLINLLESGGDSSGLLANLPIAFRRIIQDRLYQLWSEYYAVIAQAYNDLAILMQSDVDLDNRGDIAEFVLDQNRAAPSSVLFALIDGEDEKLARYVWASLKRRIKAENPEKE